MADLAQDQLILDTIAFIQANFPDVDFAGNGMTAEERIASFHAEALGGDGRSADQIRQDILEHIVGEETIAAWVEAEFTARGMDVAAGDESAEERVARITGSIMDSSRTFSNFTTTLDELGGTKQDATDTAISGDDDGTAPVGNQGTTPGIMSGGVLTKITRDGRDALWAMTYTFGDIEHVYTFESYDKMTEALGADAVTSGTYGFLEMGEDDVNDGDTWILGGAAAFVGREGSYNAWFGDALSEASLEAGSSNPGALGAFYSDPDIAQKLAEGAAGGWSKDRIQAEIRTTDYYLNVMYPGISNILAAGGGEPEAEYMQYVKTVDSSLEMLGYERDADGTFKSVTGSMLDKGISADKFTTFAPTFVRAEQSQDFADNLNKWTEQDLGVSIKFEDWFDVLDGNTTPEIDQVVEKATLSFTAERSDTLLDDATISRLAELTDISEQQMQIAFSNAEQSLLAVGQADLARFGLTQEALVAAAFNIESVGVDPLNTDGSAFTAGEVQKRARKAATELGIQDDRKKQFFVGFDSFGAPTRKGLAVSSPEAG